MNTHPPTPQVDEDVLRAWLHTFDISNQTADLISVLILCSAVLVITIIVTFILRKILLPKILRWVRSNNYKWDDAIINNNVLQKASWFIPVMLISLSIDTLLDPTSPIYTLVKRLSLSGFVVVAISFISAILNTINDIHKIFRKSPRQNLQSFVDAGKIVLYALGAIFLTSIFTGKSPWGIFSVLGGVSAVTMLVFKDSILGFIASIQLTQTDMVQIGDWIEMPQYGADGDVISISIHSIRIQNWDKTISTIPTHALVTTSFKNWRGMSESGGRRIKRAIHLDVSSICFCDDEMLDKFEKFALIEDYIKQKSAEIHSNNKESFHDTSHLINGRRQTNVGVFRAYVIAYLQNNKNLHKNMTFLVRQLAPCEHGLPLEIYVFANDQVWANYEAIQADIFDHLFAAAPEFGLRIFQNPTGFDVRSIGVNKS